jgi:3-deoxy-manno-octulosonate cytidylyltransferase (CMP-KDO synthetase)
MKVIAVIPARMASTRFPGKPLALIRGRPMIEHVYRRTALCHRIDALVVATCDAEIREVVESFGGYVVMTSPLHERSTDRIAEAAQSIIDGDIFLNVQGDEPMVRPEMLELLCKPLLEDSSLPCANLMVRLTSIEDLKDPDQVKVVFNQRGEALYMSRAPIPSTRYLGSKVPMWRQLGLIAFTSDFLQRFATLHPTPLEQAESVDMLRAIEHGYTIRMVESPFETYGVDTPEDLALVEKKMASDELLARY